MNIEILVKSSTRDEPYTVVISDNGQGLSFYCDCPAGEWGKFCKHKRALASGDVAILYGRDQVPIFEKAMKRISESDYPQLIDDLSDLETQFEAAKKKDIKRLYIHAFLDGRDVPPRSAVGYLEELDSYLEEKSLGRVATVSGRYYAMDRDNRWARTRKAYDALVYGKGQSFDSSVKLVKNAYKNGDNDEFVVPGIVEGAVNDDGCVQDGDTVIFFNFRPDRARQLTKTFIQEDFSNFNRGAKPPQVYFMSVTMYDKKFEKALSESSIRLSLIYTQTGLVSVIRPVTSNSEILIISPGNGHMLEITGHMESLKTVTSEDILFPAISFPIIEIIFSPSVNVIGRELN